MKRNKGLEKKLGPWALPARLAGELLGDLIIKCIDRAFDGSINNKNKLR